MEVNGEHNGTFSAQQKNNGRASLEENGTAHGDAKTVRGLLVVEEGKRGGIV